MIIKKITEKGLVLRYSDKGVYLRQVETGIEYASAVDVDEDKYTYEETEREIEHTDIPEMEG